MFRKILILQSLLVLAFLGNAQVKIGSNASQISRASILELESTNKGLLLPRIQDTILLDSLNPPDGLLIYVKDVNNRQNLLVRKNNRWETLQLNSQSNLVLGATSLSTGGTYTSVTGLTNLSSANLSASNITANTFSGTLSGTASKANLLTTARNINGVPFDGSADIVLPPPFANNFNLGSTNIVLGGAYSSVTGLSNLSATNITATTFSGTLSGTASKANALSTTRNINGVPFDGSADITVTTPSNNEWYLAGTTNEAGNNKTSAIYRTGSIGVGTNSPTAKLDVAAGTTTSVTGINLSGSINDFLQYNVKNTSTGTGAQSGYAATADNGTDATGFAWMGINNSGFNNPQLYNIGAANDVTYIGSGNDMYIANANSNKSIIFSSGKSTSPYFNERMRIAPNGYLGIGTNAPQTNLDVLGNIYLRDRVGGMSTGYGIEWSTSSNAPRVDFVYNGTYVGQFASDANDLLLKTSKLNTGGFQFYTNISNVNASRMNLTNAGYLGIGIVGPVGRLIVNDNAYITSIPLNATNLADNINYRPLSRGQVTNGTTNNALSDYFTINSIATQAHNLSTGAPLTYLLQPAGGLLSIGGYVNLTGIKSNTSSPTVVTSSATGLDNIIAINSNGELYKKPATNITNLVSTGASFSYTLTINDNNTTIFVSTNATGTLNANINIPNGMPAGFTCQIINDGTGHLGFTATGTATLSSANGYSARTAFSGVHIVYKTNTAAYLTGDIAP
ncbi:MAG: hypothetical protein RLZ56_1443 [Bacteroidota bacterium]|jgi:hypothetical protein